MLETCVNVVSRTQAVSTNLNICNYLEIRIKKIDKTIKKFSKRNFFQILENCENAFKNLKFEVLSEIFFL